jgi:hypothetical protein
LAANRLCGTAAGELLPMGLELQFSTRGVSEFVHEHFSFLAFAKKHKTGQICPTVVLSYLLRLNLNLSGLETHQHPAGAMQSNVLSNT